MLNPSYLILYVEDVASSIRFYNETFNTEPAMVMERFASYATDSGISFAIWEKHNVMPPIEVSGTEMELAFAISDQEDIDQKYLEWKANDIQMAHEPIDLPFGRTFTALDPDGHRLRITAPLQSM